MKYLALLLVCVALAQGERDWKKIIPKHIISQAEFQKARLNPNLRITGGEEADPHEFPWQVGLFLPLAEGTAFCGGSLITPQTVLTAAHCLDEPLVGDIQVVLGAHRIREEESSQVIVNTGDFIIHPGWSKLTLQNDLGLIFLPEAVELNENVQTIPLPQDDTKYTEQVATVSGWGKDTDSATSISPILRKVDLKVITNTVCNIAYFGAIEDTQLCCSGSDGKSTCNGDSGGPLVIHGVQIGIVSFGIVFGCEVGWPPAFTRVSSFRDWIQDNLRA